MRTSTLKSRIIILLTIFTICTIGIFVTIQLSHGLELVSRYLEYSSKEYSRQIEEGLNEILASSSKSGEEKVRSLGDVLQLFIDEYPEEIKNLYVFDLSGKIIASTESSVLGGSVDYADYQILDKFKHNTSVHSETIVDKNAKLLIVYAPLREKQNLHSVVKIFFYLGDIWKAFAAVYQPAFFVAFLLVLVNIALGVFLARLIIGPIKVFNEAAKTIAAGRLDLRVRVHTGDELEELAETFNSMTQELIKMKERAENANPLTKLPGNLVIMEEVEQRLKRGTKFTVIYCDLDNFKAFNDKYGVHKGDEAIKIAADIFKEAIRHKGDKNDFLGHEGGDDFILIAVPAHAALIAEYIIAEFDKRIRSLYSAEDLEKGCIVSTSRDGKVCSFPIMTISLAGVTNEHRAIKSYGEITNIAAEIKKKAKREARSCFVLDQRKD